MSDTTENKHRDPWFQRHSQEELKKEELWQRPKLPYKKEDLVDGRLPNGNLPNGQRYAMEIPSYPSEKVRQEWPSC